jgi:hypothetical protein
MTVSAAAPLPPHLSLHKMNEDRRILEFSISQNQPVKPEALPGINWEIAKSAVSWAQSLPVDTKDPVFRILMDRSFQKPEHIAPLMSILIQILDEEVILHC